MTRTAVATYATVPFAPWMEACSRGVQSYKQHGAGAAAGVIPGLDSGRPCSELEKIRAGEWVKRGPLWASEPLTRHCFPCT